MARGEDKREMGYSAKCIDAEFDIEPDKRPGALAALKALADRPREHDWGYTDYEEVAEATDLFTAIRTFGWECPFLLESGPSDQYLQAASYLYEKLSYGDKLLFNTIAPFVKPGSYLEMSGEDGARWRYVFDGKVMKEVSPTVSW